MRNHRMARDMVGFLLAKITAAAMLVIIRMKIAAVSGVNDFMATK